MLNEMFLMREFHMVALCQTTREAIEKARWAAHPVSLDSIDNCLAAVSVRLLCVVCCVLCVCVCVCFICVCCACWLSFPSPPFPSLCLCRSQDTPWVVRECCVRVPATKAAAEALLHHGLRKLEELHAQHQAAPWAVQALDTLQRYKDRLRTFVKIRIAEGQAPYDDAAYWVFRDVKKEELVDDLARAGRFLAVGVMLSRYPDLRRRLLAVLDCVPETVDPQSYEALLPGPGAALTSLWWFRVGGDSSLTDCSLSCR